MSMNMSSADQFNQEQEHTSTLEAFNEFTAKFGYQYEALNREAPRSMQEAEAIHTWKEKDKRKVFLGKFSHRNLQMLYEDLSQEDQRDAMTFNDMVKLFQDHFRQSTNQTLANYRFRKMVQEETESFDTFCIRIKRESKNCNFKCGSNTCTVGDVMVKDQILFGVREADIRKSALKNDWDLATLLKKGRAVEASDKGVATIKQEPEEEVKRTKPGKYSRKSTTPRKGGGLAQGKNSPQTRDHGKTGSRNKCKTCSDPRCNGDRNCRGKKGSCFGCGEYGHFMGAEACKKPKDKRKKSRRVDFEVSSSSSDSERQEDSEDEPPSLESTSDEESGAQGASEKKTIHRVFSRLSTIRRIGGRRIAKVRRSKSRYTVDVVIKERKVPVFCDTGADVCIMSKANAKRLKLDIVKTSMTIRPYGSRSQRCLGETVCTIMFEDKVATARLYILDAKVETLLSGSVSEELGIITMHSAVNCEQASVMKVSGAQARIMERFPALFKGTGTMKDYKVKFHIDESIPTVHQPARPVPFHLR